MRGGKVPPWAHIPGRTGSIPVRASNKEGTAKGQIGFELRGRVTPGCSIHLPSANSWAKGDPGPYVEIVFKKNFLFYNLYHHTRFMLGTGCSNVDHMWRR